jgi:hypothetical protein
MDSKPTIKVGDKVKNWGVVYTYSGVMSFEDGSGHGHSLTNDMGDAFLITDSEFDTLEFVAPPKAVTKWQYVTLEQFLAERKRDRTVAAINAERVAVDELGDAYVKYCKSRPAGRCAIHWVTARLAEVKWRTVEIKELEAVLRKYNRAKATVEKLRTQEKYHNECDTRVYIRLCETNGYPLDNSETQPV